MEKEELITIKDAAKRLALSPSTIRGMIRVGTLARVKIGSAVRVREGDIAALVRLGMIKGRGGQRKKANGR